MLKIMIIEDEKDHFDLMALAIKKEFPDAVVELCEKADLCLGRLEEDGVDIIIADYLLAGRTGLQLLEDLKEHRIEAPVIMVTGHGDEGLAVKAMKSGAFDYVVKSGSFFEFIPEIVRKAVHDRELKAKVRRAQEEQARLESQLQQARKMEAIATLTGGIAHDYNNLLTTIMGNISLAKMEVGAKDPVMDLLNEAEEACLKTRNLTHRLMNLSKAGASMRKPGPIEDLLEQTVRQILTDTDIDFSFFIPEDLYPVHHDAHQMCHVIESIISNSVEAMPGDGTITVTAENMRIKGDDRASALPLNAGPYVRISIQDEGVGIPEEIMDQIFDPYFSSKERGTQKGMGMNLAAAYAIVRNHGGHITATSVPGEGTTVYVFLPACEDRDYKGMVSHLA